MAYPKALNDDDKTQQRQVLNDQEIHVSELTILYNNTIFTNSCVGQEYIQQHMPRDNTYMYM